MSFGEYIDPTAAIAAILKTYSFSIGLLRELLQNSDDAEATKQIFVLDHRHHPTGNLLHEDLAATQGPAFLAANNASFKEADWTALQAIYQSSKVTDTSKIGKYGIGFRACYHITDNPQILSGSDLAVFDPSHNFSPTGGQKVDFIAKSKQCSDHIAAFNWFHPRESQMKPYRGTVIRLPLRTVPGSKIIDKVVHPSEIRQLFDDFIE
ncbi:hypothetical protein BV22DRAFT_1017573, partial [Leucogyrophana mollusca]